jgi:hypothetical protein
MKGMEFSAILTLLLVVAIIFIVAVVVINPGVTFGKNVDTQIGFRDFCFFWSLNGYKEKGSNDHIIRNEIDYGTPNDLDHCPSALGKPLGITNDDVESCINICRGNV